MHSFVNRSRIYPPAGTESWLARFLACVSLGAATASYSICAQAAGAFTFDFAPDNTFSTFGYSSTVVHGDTGITGQTPFLYEKVTDSNGVDYYHMIIGSPASGFAEEVYIGQTSPFNGYGSLGNVAGVSDSGGNFGANGSDPLGTVNGATFSGNGSGNPNNVLLDMVLSDGEISMQFLKDKFDRKPVIAQSINAPDITSSVVIDMRNSTYSDMNTPGVMMNTMSLQGPDIPPGQAQFVMSRDAQNSYVNAGRYTYSSGTYTYLDGGFNSGGIKWEDFFDPNQSNPWSLPANHP